MTNILYWYGHRLEKKLGLTIKTHEVFREFDTLFREFLIG